MLDLSLDENLETRFTSVLANNDPEAIAWLLPQDTVLLGLADSGAHVSQLCDACFATDLLGNWVRDKEVMPLEHAIHKLTGEPAGVFGLDDRGTLEVGKAADVVVFDFDTVAPGPLRRIRDFPADGERLVADAPRACATCRQRHRDPGRRRTRSRRARDPPRPRAPRRRPAVSEHRETTVSRGCERGPSGPARSAESGQLVIDPVTAEVIRSAMETICFEMATYVSRTATTPILNQSNERNATILDGQGRLAALSVGIPQFMLSATLPVRFCLEYLEGELYPGDVLVANDPYHGGGHLPDFNVFSPVFAPDGSGDDSLDGHPVLIASIQCHHGDTGGALAGGYNVFAKDIWSEGTRYPLLKIVEAGRERRDVVLTMRANNRLPGFIGDLRSQVGAAQLGVAPARRDHRAVRRRHREGRGRLDDRRRAPPVQRGDRALARRHLRGRRLRRLRPGGQHRHPRARRRHRRRRPADRRLRGFRRPPGDPGVVDVRQHARLHDRRSSRALVDPSIPKNEGFFDCIDLRVPLGSCVNPIDGQARQQRHAPSGCRGRRRDRARDGADPPRPVRAADLQVRQRRARCGATATRARASRSSTTAARVNAGWVNGVRDVDGWGALVASNGNLIKASAEINEVLFPHILRGRNYLTDSGGAGQWRGGCGSHFVKEVRTPTLREPVRREPVHTCIPGSWAARTGSPDQLHAAPRATGHADRGRRRGRGRAARDR